MKEKYFVVVRRRRGTNLKNYEIIWLLLNVVVA